MKAVSLIALISLSIVTFSQKNEIIDSLKQVIKTTKNDSIKIEAYYEWDNLIYIENPKLDEELNQKMAAISEENLKKSNLTPSLRKYFKASLARSQNVLGLILVESGNYKKAHDLFQESLSIATELEDTAAMAGPVNNLGMVFKIQGMTEEALEYYQMAMELDGATNLASKAIYLNNMGLCYASLKKYEVALEMYRKSISLSRQTGEIQNELNALSNIGEIFYERGEYDSSMHYFEQALEMSHEINDQSSIIHISVRIGFLHHRSGNPALAVQLCSEGLELNKKVNSLKNNVGCHECLYKAYKELGQIQKSFYHLEKFNALKDTMFNKENIESIKQRQYEIEYEKQKVADSLEVVKQEEIKQVKLKSDLRKKETQQYVLYGGIIVLFLLGGLIYRSYALKKKDNDIIASQKMEVEEKNKEILDSITYAKRIQTAILPPDDLVDKVIPDAFILYKPKDIVAGDFYWLEEIDNRIYLAVADCTGHGVPGAMVSVVCHNALNRSVREYKLTSPDKILDKTRELVIETFAKSKESVKDGMDISLISWDKGDNKIQFAGANNSVYVVRNSEEPVLEEFKADKQPIGQYAGEKPFNMKEITLNKGDVLYAFTDGFADQFGGPNGKKYKYKQLKDKCLSVFNLAKQDQKQFFQSEFNSWKGQLEQIDDVCFMGLSLN